MAEVGRRFNPLVLHEIRQVTSGVFVIRQYRNGIRFAGPELARGRSPPAEFAKLAGVSGVGSGSRYRCRGL